MHKIVDIELLLVYTLKKGGGLIWVTKKAVSANTATFTIILQGELL